MFSLRNVKDRAWSSLFAVMMLSTLFGLSACSGGSSDSFDDLSLGEGGDFATAVPTSWEDTAKPLLQRCWSTAYSDSGSHQAPFALDSYHEVFDRRGEIRLALLSESCIHPPATASQLTEEEQGTVLAWLVSIEPPLGSPQTGGGFLITPSHVVGDLNAAVKGSGPSGRAVKLGAPVYQPASGYGVLIRNFNDGQPSGSQKFLASTLWHNDINAPNMVYPYNETLSATLPRNPCQYDPARPTTCPLFGTDVNNLSYDAGKTGRQTGYWWTPSLVAVYNLTPGGGPNTKNWSIDPWKDSSGMKNAKKTDWKAGVFYSHDSNSEKRAFPIFDKWSVVNGVCTPSITPTPAGASVWGYDAPYGYLPAPMATSGVQKVFARDGSKFGASDKYIGNPRVHLPTKCGTGPSWGAGAGIHVASDYSQASDSTTSQIFDRGSGGMDTYNFGIKYKLWRQDHPTYKVASWGEANYAMRGADGTWSQLITAMGNGKAYWKSGVQWIMDLLIPWVSNFPDLITINSALYAGQKTILGRDVLDSVYWGWNEVPINKNFQTEKQGGASLQPVAYVLVLPENDVSIQQSLWCDANKSEKDLSPTEVDPKCRPYENIGRQLYWYASNQFIANQSTIILARMLFDSTANVFYKDFNKEDFKVTYTGRSPSASLVYTVKDGTLTCGPCY